MIFIRSRPKFCCMMKGYNYVKILPFDKNSDRICHKFVGHLKNFMGECSGDEDDLGGWGQVSVHIINLFFET